ncbi:phosphotransferase family protein [Gottfriedia luciferensis]|uniref:phosphotransferase family protein n=1 Tax=Gottfriedia luciferensis TaxID=178774 RepID=UPI000B451464|nr:phosphotransferase family protein [Gottfriedia luciferensis]
MTEKVMLETIQVRKGEELNVRALHHFLQEKIDDLPSGELSIRQFSAGHSNLTYLLKIKDWEVVLRRPPLGPVAPKAHDMKREFRILSEIQPHFSAAPKPILFSEDESIVGSSFFVMERKNGEVFDSSFPEHLNVTKEDRKTISNIMVEKLVELHSIDYTKTNLLEISKPENFMDRQVNGWIGRYNRAKTNEIPVVDQFMGWLVNNIPKNHESAIIHYDFKLNNSMFSHDLKELIGLFDWEMTTIGDPLADLGVALSYWIQNDDPDLLKYGLGNPSVTIQDGFMTRDQFIEAYAKKSGRDLSNIHYYLAFAYFKLAVIVQQIFYRFKSGQTNDQRFVKFDQFAENLIKIGYNLVIK